MKQNQNGKSLEISTQQVEGLIKLYQEGHFEEAQGLAIELTTKFPTHQLSWKLLAILFRQSGKIIDALNASQKAVALSPNDYEAINTMGNSLNDLSRYDTAEAAFRRSLKIKPDFGSTHYNLANLLYSRGSLHEAEEAYKRALDLDPNRAMFHNSLGNLFHESGKFDDAEASYKKALNLQPNYADVYYNLGILLKDMGKIKEAVASYNQAVSINPNFVEAFSNMGNALRELGELEKAKEAFDRAITLKPDYTDGLLSRWQLLFDKGEFDAALCDADACNTKISRAHGLVTLYALGKIEEIYKRIQMQSEVDAYNIRVSSFSSFLSKTEGRDTAHTFCPNPMSMLYFTNISKHSKIKQSFIQELINELGAVQTSWEPKKRTTRKGFQTVENINLFEESSPKVSELKQIIIDELNFYYSKFKNEACSYIQKWPSQKNIVGWHVVLKQQGYQGAHIHPSGWLSGVIYLKVVPALGKDEGAIEFSLNGTHFSHVKAPKLIFEPKDGDIVFFPSSLHHRTIPFTTDADRIIISFDLMPEVKET